MNFFIGVTDYEWFRLHAGKQNVEEVNFWRPSPDTRQRRFGTPFIIGEHKAKTQGGKLSHLANAENWRCPEPCVRME